MKYWVKASPTKISEKQDFFNLPMFTAFKPVNEDIESCSSLFSEHKAVIIDADFTDINFSDIDYYFMQLMKAHPTIRKFIINIPFSENNVVALKFLSTYKGDQLRFAMTIPANYTAVIKANQVLETGVDYLILKVEKTDYINNYKSILKFREIICPDTKIVLEILSDREDDIKAAMEWMPDIIFN